MSTSMKDLFDDDSSSEEEEVMSHQETLSGSGDATAQSPSKGVILEDDEEEEEEAIKPKESQGENLEMKEETGEQQSSEHKSASENVSGVPNPASENDKDEDKQDDDDDDDVEFDDGGNIVGSSAPPPTAQPDDDERMMSPGRTIHKARPKKPRHMQVLHSDRPPASTTLHMTKLPNLVGIQPDPFDPDTYSADMEERDYRGYVHSMIRWRYLQDAATEELQRDAQGKLMRESNARIVKWEDGSYTLHVGTEVLDMDAINSSSKDFAGLNGYLYLSQKATFRPEEEGKEDIPGGTVLECMGAIQSRLIPRPSSLQSEAHKKLTVAVRQRTIKKARIAEYVTQEDPEKAKMEKIRVKEDLEKASARKSRAYRNSGRRSTPGMNRSYLEEDDGEYDTTNIRALKRKNMDELMDFGDDSEDEDDDDEGTPWANRSRPTRAAKARREEEEAVEDEEELAFGEESSEEEEFAPAKKPSAGKKLTHQAVLDDDDDDDE